MRGNKKKTIPCTLFTWIFWGSTIKEAPWAIIITYKRINLMIFPILHIVYLQPPKRNSRNFKNFWFGIYFITYFSLAFDVYFGIICYFDIYNFFQIKLIGKPWELPCISWIMPSVNL